MTTKLTRARLLAAVAATLALAGGAVENASATGSVSKATKLLQNKRLTAYVNGSATNSTIQRDVDLCPRGRLFYRSVFSSEHGVAEEEAQGRWRVISARMQRGYGWAKVRWTAGAYGGTSRIVASRRGVRVDGYPVEVTRSPAC